MPDLTPKQKRLLALAKAGGKDSDLLILDEIEALESKFDEKTDEITATFEKFVTSIETSFEKAIEEIKENVPNLDEVLKSIKGKDGEDSKVAGPKGDKGDSIIGPEGKSGAVGPMGPKPILGIDYEAPKDGKDGESIVGPAGKDGSPDTAEQIVSKLESLEGNDRLNKSAINGLNEEFAKLAESNKGRQIYGPGKTRVLLLDLSSQLNGSLKTFTIGTHFGIIGVFGSSSPFAYRPVIDYNESGRDIVFTAELDATIALATGQTLVVQYLR
jgi:hypothetical protein